ncbi:MAG TPA: SEC-C metal-binding domain-containing protein, partial [Nocardioidaceae bacterium]|nr:SEC-C metal-binding domain-containing protein [Nocardioidaceae bacterium]
QGHDLGSDPLDTIDVILSGDDLPFVMPLADGRLASLDALLVGRTFTHRLTGPEVTLGFLEPGTDLSAISLLVDQPPYCRLTDGSPVTFLIRGLDDDLLAERGVPADVGASDGCWLLDRDLLHRYGLAAGDLLGVTVRPDGLELSTPDADETAPELLSTLAASLAEFGEGDPVESSALVWQMCDRVPELFTRPGPPLSELLAEAGLAVEGDWVAPAGFDFSAWRAGNAITRVCELHDLNEDEALAVLAMTVLYAGVAGGKDQGGDLREGLDDDVIRPALGFLVEPAVAAAVLVETIGAGTEGAAALAAFAETFEPIAQRRARAGLRWLRGKALDRSGAALAAEQAYESSIELDDYPLALLELARIASDRGDAERAMSLLRRAGAPADDELVVMLEKFLPAERRDLLRNGPCWCGSGRKYKVCHQNREALPLAERAAWLYAKAVNYLTEGPWRGLLLDLAELRSEYDREPLAVYRATQDPLVIDCALFEGGAFAAFLVERGVLLPEDERLLGEQWLLAERSLWDIEEVTPGSGFLARDTRTGDRVLVRERLGSRAVSAGALVCARFVPAGDTVQCFGGMEVVSLGLRDSLLKLLDTEPTAEELVGFLTAQFAPPELQNTEGDPLVFCKTVLHSPDPAALAAALDSSYARDASEMWWHEYVTTHGMERVRATITVDDSVVRVETNSEARHDRVLAVLRSLQPGLELVHESRSPARDVQEAVSRAPADGATRPSPGPEGPEDPEVASALASFVREYEQAWLDDHIPALDGRTPREAAADPTRRPDLIRLLESFPAASGPGQMDPARLRSALGLEETGR